jgi:small-conductance mechanosensitive channel
MDYSSWTGSWREALIPATQKITMHLPNVLSAAALLLLGWLVARLVRAWTSKLISVGFERIVRTPAGRTTIERTGVRRTVPGVVSTAAFWLVLLLFAAAAVEVLGLPAVTNLVARIAYYLPNVFAAILIVFAGYVAGNLASAFVSATAMSMHLPYAAALGRSAHAAIVMVAVVIGINQLGVDSTFLVILLSTVLATSLGGAAIAFGLGSRTAVSNIIGSHYLRKTCKAGQQVKIEGIEGRILEITPTMVILATYNGRVLIPAKKFSEEISLLGTGEA